MSITDPQLLITDDDRDFRETLQDVFQGRGFRTVLAADGEEALWVVSRERIHLVLVDQHMPRLSGLETARRIKGRMADLPCILISAALDEAVIAEARAIPVDRILAKPVTFAEVTLAVAHALRQCYNWTPPR